MERCFSWDIGVPRSDEVGWVVPTWCGFWQFFWGFGLVGWIWWLKNFHSLLGGWAPILSKWLVKGVNKPIHLLLD